jgi:cytochrome P450
MQPAFMPRTVELMRQRAQRIVDDALVNVIPTGHLEVMDQFARPLSAAFKQDLLAVPAEDRANLQRWSRDIAVFMGGWQGIAQAHRSMTDLNEYLRGVIAERRKRPGDDLLSLLVTAEAQGDRLREDELFANALGLIFLGTSGVANIIGNGLLALLRNPEQLALLRQNPTLIEPAVEEMLRYDSPDQAVLRVAKDSCEVAGQQIDAGQAVSLWIGSANRDPDRFVDPDRFDITRGENRHLAFAAGPHYCLGAAMARMQAHVAIGRVLRALPDLCLGAAAIEWEGSLNLRALKTLPVTFTPGAP